MADLIWPEFEQIKLELKHELSLVGGKLADRILENDGQVDENLFVFGTHLNYMKLSKLGLTRISSSISKLNNLTRLVLSDNEIFHIPAELGSLSRLIYLDLSQNKINVLPDIFANMSKLQTLNLQNNVITEITSFKGLEKVLQELLLDHNELQVFPSVLELEQMLVLGLSHNRICSIPSNIFMLKSLKVLNLEENLINEVPCCIGQMLRLKQIMLKNNPLKNEKTQLKKLINDDLYKALMDYFRKLHMNSSNQKNHARLVQANEEFSNRTFYDNGKVVKVLNDDKSHQVFVISRSKLEKSQVIYFIVHNVRLNNEKLKAFIKFQEHLHKVCCDSRKQATVGVHDFSTVAFPLCYLPKNSDDFVIQMMNRQKNETGRALYDRLIKESENERKSKKRGSPSGLYQYLYLLDISVSQGIVEDSEGLVISYPPLTNSNITKMTSDSTDLLVEVIGSKLDKCRSICDKIVEWIVENQLTAGDCLEIEPVRIIEKTKDSLTDGGDKFLLIYPGRTDLSELTCTVIRT